MVGPLLYGVLVPALVGGAFWGIGWRAWSRRGEPLAGGRWAGPPALALGCLAGSLALWGWPGLPPKLAEGWLPFLAAAGLAGGLVESLLLRGRIRTLTWILLSAFLTWAVLGPRRTVWSAGVSAAWHLSVAAGALVLHATVDRLAARRPGASMPLALWLWSAGTAAALALTHSLKYGQLAGLAAAGLWAGVVVSWLRPSLTLAGGAASVLVPWTGALLVCGHLYSDLPALPALLLAAAPAALWLGEAGPVARRAPWAGVLARLALVGVPVAAALLIAGWSDLFPEPGSHPY